MGRSFARLSAGPKKFKYLIFFIYKKQQVVFCININYVVSPLECRDEIENFSYLIFLSNKPKRPKFQIFRPCSRCAMPTANRQALSRSLSLFEAGGGKPGILTILNYGGGSNIKI